MIELPSLPPKPADLEELEARYSRVRAQKRSLENRIAAAIESMRQADGKEDNVARLASELVEGKRDTISRAAMPEDLAELREQLAPVELAARQLRGKIADARARHNSEIAEAFRPAHEKAVRRVYAALLELEAANAQEAAVRAAVPGVPLPPLTFPNLGTSACGGGPLAYWIEHARRHGFLEEPEPEEEPSIVRKVARKVRSSVRANGASEPRPVPMAAASRD